MRRLHMDTCLLTGVALKRTGAALDSTGGMRTQELKLRVQRADYVIDPVAVAEAMLRYAVSHRRWWNPTALCAMPLADNSATGCPATTSPIQVNGTASSATERSSAPMQTHSS